MLDWHSFYAHSDRLERSDAADLSDQNAGAQT